MLHEQMLANAIRILSIDCIQHANSGHPGAPMGMADIAEVLWREYMNHNPKNPNWINRDRFILSNGHASMLLYSILHLTGYKISIEDLKNFRQLHSKTPGHPEYKHTDGVEVTTGPLGQGLANAVGFAIAERTLANQFNRPLFNIIDHYTYVFVGDGCMMEGISHESCSLAGTMKLNKLIVLYDKNGISIDGSVEEWFSDNTAARFESYGWHVIPDVDGHNRKSINIAINQAKSILNKPSLIIFKTIIAFGSPNKSGQSCTHGSPLGTSEILATRNKLCWNEQTPFLIPQKIYKLWDATIIGQQKENIWNQMFLQYQKTYPDLAQELTRRVQCKLPIYWNTKIQKLIKQLSTNPQNIATRQSSQIVIEYISKYLPELLGGSADLTSSNLTTYSQSSSIIQNPSGNYIHYGVREFGMTAIANGISVHGGFLPYTATFLTFSDYSKNAIRMAALMNNRHIMIYTHDSIGLGEDGPTHQPIEQLSSLRMIPNLQIWRPCDQIETVIAWKTAIENTGPTVLILTRQTLKQQKNTIINMTNISKGGYILQDCYNTPELIIIATGSEIELAVNIYHQLTNEGYKIRIVSMPCTNIFDQQNATYREQVLPQTVTKRLAIEAGHSDLWYKYVGLHGKVIGINTFGKSAPAHDLFNFFGFTKNHILQEINILLQ
ncbi:transketolase [Candidatus Blochmanniella floridana]|uniref:Transketolase n=1 Tax=Blochmanniella floridana TaxID=203907 RepID=Q7VRT3_BLOFL|nr:transketolase [Candidatus Blochmannia floridanus]